MILIKLFSWDICADLTNFSLVYRDKIKSYVCRQNVIGIGLALITFMDWGCQFDLLYAIICDCHFKTHLDLFFASISKSIQTTFCIWGNNY